MRMLKHAGEDRAPYEWRPISGEQLNRWRQKRRQSVKDGVSTYGVQTGYRNLPSVDSEEGDTGIIKRRTGPVEIEDPLETQAQMVAQYNAWINDPTATREQKAARIQILRALTGTRFQHLSDTDVALSIGQVAGDLARDSAERVYKTKGWDKGTELTTDGVRVVTNKPEYDSSEWAVPTGKAEPKDRRFSWQRSQDS